MHGITLTKKPEDWQILQQENGFAQVSLSGHFQVHPAAINVGVAYAQPMIRVISEEDNSSIIPWQPIECDCNPDFSGTFETQLSIPAGGLYRIETCLSTQSTNPDILWRYRGDCALHIGVGNLFILAGQSNAAGYSRDYCPDAPDIHVHLFRNRSRWDLACHPMNESTDAGSLPNEEMGTPGVSPYLSFAKQYYKLSGMPVGLIQTTLGGSPMRRWLPESDPTNPEVGDLYNNMMNKIQMTGKKYAGILWYQGCSDADPDSAPYYFVRFSSMVYALRKELGYEIPFFTFQLNRQVGGLHDSCWGMIREAQRRAAREIPATYVLSTTNCGLSDCIHNNAASNLVLGEKAAKLCYHVLNNGEPFFAPDLSAIEMLDDTHMMLTFSNTTNFIQCSREPQMNSFTITDSDGEVPLAETRANIQDKNHVYITLNRQIKPDAVISFAWDANPTAYPIMDEVTFLPPLSFYQVPVFPRT